MKNVEIIVYNANQLLTMDSDRAQIANEDNEAKLVGVIENGAVAVLDGKVAEVGTSEEILDSFSAPKMIDASNCVVCPGLIDPHTHLVFAGSRHIEFGMRMHGDQYLEILAAGGGIHSTVLATRMADEDELFNQALSRLKRSLSFGVTTLEAKSGYGLDEKTEIKILRVIKKLNNVSPIKITSTYLGAHVIPLEYKENRADYVDLIISKMIPKIANQKLADACDVFLDDGAFNIEEAGLILQTAREHSLKIKIHAGQFTDQAGPLLMAKMGGLSADHLEVVNNADIQAMAKSGVVANLLPGAAFSLRDNFPDARRFIDAGVDVALATDNNPGSSRSENLPLMASMGVTRMGLSCSEAWRGITVNAAKALGLKNEVGSLIPGQNADILLLSIPDFRAFLYHFGINHTNTVLIGGKVVAEGLNT